MYKLDRTRKMKIIFESLTVIFLVLFVRGFAGGGYEIIKYGFMNEPLASIMMVSSLFCAVICALGFFALNALEKDIAEWLEILEKETENKK